MTHVWDMREREMLGLQQVLDIISMDSNRVKRFVCTRGAMVRECEQRFLAHPHTYPNQCTQRCPSVRCSLCRPCPHSTPRTAARPPHPSTPQPGPCCWSCPPMGKHMCVCACAFVCFLRVRALCYRGWVCCMCVLSPCVCGRECEWVSWVLSVSPLST